MNTPHPTLLVTMVGEGVTPDTGEVGSMEESQKMVLSTYLLIGACLAGCDSCDTETSMMQ